MDEFSGVATANGEREIELSGVKWGERRLRFGVVPLIPARLSLVPISRSSSSRAIGSEESTSGEEVQAGHLCKAVTGCRASSRGGAPSSDGLFEVEPGRLYWGQIARRFCGDCQTTGELKLQERGFKSASAPSHHVQASRIRSLCAQRTQSVYQSVQHAYCVQCADKALATRRLWRIAFND